MQEVPVSILIQDENKDSHGNYESVASFNPVRFTETADAFDPQIKSNILTTSRERKTSSFKRKSAVVFNND